jgi:hypothetical protein
MSDQYKGSIFRWRSNALKQYGSGHIFASGITVEDARRRALSKIEDYLRKNYESWFYDPEDTENVDDFMAKFKDDIMGEPEDQLDVCFMRGSE